ncbi:MAG: TIGR04013 family B12-binding domain/radical SAM domain-containing protein [Candidatus Thorarchaeota archaeon]
MNNIFLIRWRPKNYYSFGSLLPILKNRYPTIPIMLIKEKNCSELAKKVGKLVKESNITFYFDSFMSIDIPIIKEEMTSILNSIDKIKHRKFFSIAGGAHPTAAPINTLDLGYDIAAKGEGEIIIDKIVDVILNSKSWSEIPSIVFNEQGFLRETTAAPRINLDEYQPFSIDPPIHPPIELMRGCSFGCKFCQVPRILRSIRYRSLESIDKIVAYYFKRYESRSQVDIRFIAPNSLEYGSLDHRTPNIDALWKLVETVKKYPVRMFLGSFPSEVRPEFVNPETVAILQQSDSKIVAVGAQSGNEQMLEKMNRGHDLTAILNCVDYLLDGQLIPQLDFIIGLPEETVEEMWDTINLTKQLIQKGCKIRFHGFLPLPGTPWGSKPGTPVPNDIISEIGKLTLDKNVNGAFAKQLELASPIFSYR